LVVVDHQLQSVEAIKQWLGDVSRVILPTYRRQHFQQVSQATYPFQT
jgi:hypothetical protein